MLGVDLTLAFLVHSVGEATGQPIAELDEDRGTLPAPVSKALLTTFGVRQHAWNHYRTPEPLDETDQQLFMHYFNGPGAVPADPSEATGGAFGMPRQFTKDLARSTYLLQQPDGSFIPLIAKVIDLDEGSPTRDAVLQAARQTLEDFVGNPAALRALMDTAVQTSLTGFAAILLSPSSPARLDGKPGYLASDPADVQITYVVRQDDQGRLLVRCDHDIGGRATFILSDGTAVPLDPERSGARLTVELAIAPDGSVSVHGHTPVAYCGQLHKAPLT